MTRVRGAIAAGVGAAVLAAGAPAVVQGAGRPILPPHPTGHHLPYGAPDCPTGDPECIRQTVAEMYRRINAVVPVCDHRAVFALAYTRTTEDLGARIAAGAFDDPVWLARIDRVFASMYFAAYDAFAGGRRDLVPPAWAMGFEAAARRQAFGIGNFLIEFSAHVNRDLAFALEIVGTTRPDGTSHKPDFDRVIDTVTALHQSVLAEIVERFDPRADDLDVAPFNRAVPRYFREWRERAWRNAERLLTAPTAEARAAVAAEIERDAEADGRRLLAGLRYRDASHVRERDAWCAQHGGQRPAAYRPGAAALRVRRGRIVVRGSRALVTLACPWPSLGCSGTVAIDRRRRTVGRRSYELGAGKLATLRVQVARGARGRAVVRLTRAGVPGARRSASAHIRLQRTAAR